MDRVGVRWQCQAKWAFRLSQLWLHCAVCNAFIGASTEHLAPNKSTFLVIFGGPGDVQYRMDKMHVFDRILECVFLKLDFRGGGAWRICEVMFGGCLEVL